jgi:tRNA modification GTPase
VAELKDMVRNTFLKEAGHDRREYVSISRARHRDSLVSASDILGRFSAGLVSVLPLELLASDLREALSAIGSVTGVTTTDEVLDVVFSSFCIGK